jgi:hypothetical protein
MNSIPHVAGISLEDRHYFSNPDPIHPFSSQVTLLDVFDFQRDDISGSQYAQGVPWWVGAVGKVSAGYVDSTGSIPALGRVRHGRRSFRFLSGSQYP